MENFVNSRSIYFEENITQQVIFLGVSVERKAGKNELHIPMLFFFYVRRALFVLTAFTA